VDTNLERNVVSNSNSYDKNNMSNSSSSSSSVNSSNISSGKSTSTMCEGSGVEADNESGGDTDTDTRRVTITPEDIEIAVRSDKELLSVLAESAKQTLGDSAEAMLSLKKQTELSTSEDQESSESEVETKLNLSDSILPKSSIGNSQLKNTSTILPTPAAVLIPPSLPMRAIVWEKP